jgi:hypothetical protein
MMGERVVLNVVRKNGGSSSVTAEAAARLYQDNAKDLGGSARLEYSRASVTVNLDFGLLYKTEQTPDAGEGEYRRSGTATAPSLNGTFDADDWQESLQATANTSAQLGKFDVAFSLTGTSTTSTIDQASNYEDSNGFSFNEVVDIERVSDAFEVGADINRPISENRRLNIKLLHRSDAQETDSALSIGDSQVIADDEFDLSESALRAVLRWDVSDLLSLELGGEAAYNRLDSLVAVNIDGTPLDLPNSDITVSEDRYQAFATAILQPGERWVVEAELAWETSELTQSGDANLKKDFDYVKPRLTATRAINDSMDVRFRFETVVGQLSFNNFAASPCLECGIASAGNAQLEPEESDEYEVEFERRFWDAGSAILTVTYSKFKNALDYVPVEEFDALGNAGEATRWAYELFLTLPFDRLGWSGATFRTKVNYFDTEIADPFTGESRPITGRNDLTGFLGFTWELPEYDSVLGFDGYWGFIDRSYRVSEERLYREFPTPLSVWWDRTLGDGTVLRLEVWNITRQRRVRTRDIYEDGRAGGGDPVIETRSTVQEPHIMLRVRKRF